MGSLFRLLPSPLVSSSGNSGGGTVTSVDLSLPASIFNITSSPVTSSGTLSAVLAPQTHNMVLVGPTGSGSDVPTFRALVLKDLPIKLYAESITTSSPPDALGDNSIALGAEANTSISATNSLAIGAQSLTRLPNSIAYAAGRFTSSGDAQAGRYFVRTDTINGYPTEMFIDGTAGTSKIVLPDNSTWTFTATITAHSTSEMGGHAGYKVEGVVYRDSGASTVAFQGNPIKTVISESSPVWDINIRVDLINGSLVLLVVGEAGKVIRWLGVIDTVEITN